MSVSRTSSKDADPVFQRAITDLLKKYQVNLAPTDSQGQDVFILTIETLDIYLMGSPRGYLSIACKAGRLPADAGEEAYTALLNANLFTLEHPVLSVGLSAETREVLLSTRQPLSELDSAGTFRLVESVIGQAQALSEWLQAPPRKNTAPIAPERLPLGATSFNKRQGG
ncbi:CesT family type III secretion system chaperone [Pokkaliibacter sp. MBI-7]|uniref:CesT family type III secretion system chaperone n=1 Tax=Pokkaliibacter sp. MBI-7 TaxID=3040600 RepID=UPI00244903F8|nr:CesT family type III secretion system chaperone [Pokkaliibacter sp. MBI-7]MDH2431450.1 CesT family type III secretion system chaperone [Pokkaliibacter sp. MBI-7]